MSLWVDCNNLTASDLLQYDGLLPSVVSTEGIDVDSKSQAAHESISSVLATHFSDCGASPLAGRIVVTELLRRWHALLTLEGVYREAYFRHLSDRHKARADHLLLKTGEARESLLSTGVGICDSPIRRAPRPELSVAEGIAGSGIWFAAAALVLSVAEGEGSEISSIILTESAGISVRVSGPLAVGQLMHVYAGSSPDRLYRQTSAPVPTAVAVVLTQIEAIGEIVGSGQVSNRFLRTDRRVLRG